MQCAYSEGFANYHAEILSFNYFDFENSDYSYDGTSDGSIVEGAVASFMIDITDPANESFDNLNLPGSYISDIIETCEVDAYGWRRGDGIDHLVACFEQVIPDYSNYFTNRTTVPTNFRESITEPSGWNATEILRLWRRNLYAEDF